MLLLGFFLGYNYLASGSVISGLLALVILFQALTNTGCLLGQCKPVDQHQTKTNSGIEDVTFEEIKVN